MASNLRAMASNSIDFFSHLPCEGCYIMLYLIRALLLFLFLFLFLFFFFFFCSSSSSSPLLGLLDYCTSTASSRSQ